jgi:hypothetical protein
MNSRRVATIAAVLAFGLFTLAQPALAQSNCQPVKGRQAGVFDPVTNTTTGSITEGGWLNGATLEVFGSAVLPTPDPTTVSFTSDYTVATTHGELKTRNVIILNVVTGNAAVLGHIDPDTSTGKFAGAAGVVYFAGKTTSFDPFTIEAEIAGEICFAQ